MLVATREPSSHSGTQPAQPTATGFSRFVSFVQIAGSLLAVPLGLASGYSIYHANFSTEARCQGLRANIVSMLDKSADASTLRMLVRRDVASFEQSCGSVDPEAVAAFKTLLATKKVAAPVTHAGPAKPPARQANAKPVETKHADTKAGETKAAEIKRTEAKPTEVRTSATKPVASATVSREISDATWLASVREALVNHHAEPVKPVESAAPAEAEHALVPVPASSVAPAMPAAVAPALPAPSAPPVQARAVPPTSIAPPVAPPNQVTAAPVPPAAIAAPAAPPLQATVAPVQPATVASVPRRDSDHPVPPALVPEGSALPATETASNTRSGSLLSRVPFIGSMLSR